MIDFSEFLETQKEYSDKFNFYKDLESFINNSLKNNKPLIAVHAFCTDGTVSGALLRYAYPEAAIIPLDYVLLTDNSILKQLEQLPWKGIVDLIPFNKKTMEFWVDHHASSIGRKVFANKIKFDKDGDSGAYQLFLSGIINPIPEYLIELAVMTRITDTAGYITEPPIEQYNSITELPTENLSGKDARIEEEKRIWLLDDAMGGTIKSFKDHQDRYTQLAKKGFIAIDKYLNDINKLREERKGAYEIANKIPIDCDVIIFNYTENIHDRFTITRKLQKRGAKVVISLAKVSNGYKISLRRNRELNDELNQKIQLNELASLMNGGGHPGASGAFTKTQDEALTIIHKWADNIGLTVSYIDLTK